MPGRRHSKRETCRPERARFSALELAWAHFASLGTIRPPSPARRSRRIQMNAKRAGKLLLVEDENVLRGLIAQFLRVESFEVVEAADGQQAVERFTSLQPFDVVLL